MEKADILENVVKFIKCQNLHERTDSRTTSAEYRLGYIHCMREVTQVMEQICGKSTTAMVSLQQYFNNKLNNLAYCDTPRALGIKEENPSATYSTPPYVSPMVQNVMRCSGSANVFSPIFPGRVHPIAQEAECKTGDKQTKKKPQQVSHTLPPLPMYYSTPNTSYNDYLMSDVRHHMIPRHSRDLQSGSNIINIEPKSESESMSSLKYDYVSPEEKRESTEDSSFETAQIVPDSTSQLSVYIPEPEVPVLPNNINNDNNNNNGGHVVQEQGQGDMWRPW